MAKAYPKICFAFDDNGDTVHVFGACDRVELTAGISPNVVELAVPKHEFDKFDGNYQRHGILELYWSDPDTPDVMLGVWDFDGNPVGGYSVEMVEDTLSGKGVGEANAVVQEKTFTLLDRRWEFTDGLGGHAFAGLVNAKNADGKGVSNPPDNLPDFPKDGATYYQLLYWLTGRMQYATGLHKIDHDLYPPPFEPLITVKPPDLKWDGVNISKTISDLLDETEAVWTLHANGTYGIYLIGEGDAPDLPNPLPSESHQLRMTRPEIVVVTSAPRPAYDQIVIQGVGPNGDTWDDPALEYIGEEIDGTYKPVADLSYVVPHTIERAVEIVRTRFAGLDGIERDLAQSLFSKLRVKSDVVQKYLPFIGRLVDTMEDIPGSGRLRPDGPLKVEAKIAVQDEWGVWHNSESAIRLNRMSVLPREGIFYFWRLIGKVSPDASIGRAKHFSPLGYGDMSITVSVMPKFGDHRDYFTVGYKLVDGGVTELTAEQLAEALGPDSGDCTILSIPELVEHRLAGVSQNADALKITAKARAARILTNRESVEHRRHIGFHSVSPNGNIAKVCWNLRDGTTTYDWKSYFFSKSSYLDKRRLREIARGTDAGKRTSVTTPASVTEGERDHAPRLWSMGSGGAPGDMADAVGRRYGKAVNNWVNAAGDGSTVDLNPCKRDGSDTDTSVSVIAYIRRGGSYRDPNVVAGHVVAYEMDIYGDAIVCGGLDDPIGTIKASNRVDAGGAPSTPPEGWERYMGDGGRTIVEYGTAPFNVMGGTGGQQYHGGGVLNNHDDHSVPGHPHSLPTTTINYEPGASPALVLQGGTTQTGGAGGHQPTHTGTDNMMPWKVAVWIRRYDNSHVVP